MAKLEESIKQFARDLGFPLSGIARASAADQFERLTEWLGRGYAGEMDYMRRHTEARKSPSSILPEVRSVVMLGMEYGDKREFEKPNPPAPFPKSEVQPEALGSSILGKIARYAAGEDYHDNIRRQLNKLLSWLETEVPSCKGRGVVDSAPLLERDFARRAGLGWIGKNTMLINKHRGSYFFLAALLVDLELEADGPHEAQHCGTCTACLDACPTQAFAGPGWLDSRKCISYLTIELRLSIPEEFRSELDGWLFGCDVCQEVCPWNRRDRSDPESVNLIELLSLDEEDFREHFRGTALMRTKRRGLLRNAALLLGEQGDASALPALQRALADPEPMIREAAAWALERIREREKVISFQG
ncbi:MAG TPA: tRNA epoxyqueuosine(34) reductase QueG [Gemmataceae bacterium]|nr:tRNA epoxyqueuosine(34) reductase QueG [Gemmataceae bacterium]